MKTVTRVCVLLAQLGPNNSQSRCVCTQVYCNRKLKETAQEEQGSHRHVCPSSSTIALVALPPLLAIIASGLGIPHSSRKQQAHSTQSYSQKDPGRVYRPRRRSGDMRVTGEHPLFDGRPNTGSHRTTRRTRIRLSGAILQPPPCSSVSSGGRPLSRCP